MGKSDAPVAVPAWRASRGEVQRWHHRRPDGEVKSTAEAQYSGDGRQSGELTDAAGRNGVAGFFNVSTLGSRYSGDHHGLLWNFEGMYPFGTWSNQLVSAGAVTTGIGYQCANLPMNAQFWLYYDWASGSQNPSGGNIHGTFDQLFAGEFIHQTAGPQTGPALFYIQYSFKW